jgi:hypothetical protein
MSALVKNQYTSTSLHQASFSVKQIQCRRSFYHSLRIKAQTLCLFCVCFVCHRRNSNWMQYNTLLTVSVSAFIAQTQFQKFETNIPRKGISQPQSQFPHSCVCERFIYSHDRSAYSAAGKYVNRSWEYIKYIYECGNWDWGRAIPRKRKHK